MPNRRNHQQHVHRQRGAAAILAMMFLVILGSLAAAMAIVSQGNLTTAESQLRINRSLAGAETGLHWVIHRLNQIADNTTTSYGLIDDARADQLWIDPADGVRKQLYDSFYGEFHNLAQPTITTRGLRIGPVAIGAGEPTFTVSFEPHPLPGPTGVGDYSNYNLPFYQRAPYNDPEIFDEPVSSAKPLDARWIRIVVTAIDGSNANQVTRSISMDFRVDKKLRFAVLSRNRVMIGRNVMIEGNIGSRFTETHLENGHPVQMESDFRGLDASLDGGLDLLTNTLVTNDLNGDNRIDLSLPSETNGIVDPDQYDTDGDSFITEFDFFLSEFDGNADGRVSATELNTSSNIDRAQLLQMIDTFGDLNRPGYNDGFIDLQDRYAKIRGQVKIAAGVAGWQAGAANGTYQDYFQGPIVADHHEAPLTFDAADAELFSYGPNDFDTATLAAMASGDLAGQSVAQYAGNDPNDPTSPNMDLSGDHIEAVPFGAKYPYDYYNRPVYENMTFTNVRLPAGTNALFKNCRFIGVTFIETTAQNTDPNFQFAGMQNPDGSPKHPGMTVVTVDPATQATVTLGSSKTVSNNVRFDSCTFEGAIVSSPPQAFTQTRNKIAFTGQTRFDIDGSTQLSQTEKDLFKRSTILSPHYSVEMGTFVAPFDSGETVKLSGTIVAGIVDMRGQVQIDGSLITTFEAKSNTGPVLGDTSPQFNTTLGYFSSVSGDLETELPGNGMGVIQIRYNPKLPMPDGITGPIEVAPTVATYYEGIAP